MSIKMRVGIQGKNIKGGHPAPGNLALDGSITLERDSRDLLELEFILLFELLESLTSHADELATRRRELHHPPKGNQ